MEDKLKEGSEVIVKGARVSNEKNYMKLKIVEVTDVTYYIENLDTSHRFRKSIYDFENDFKVVEILKEYK